MFGYDCLDEYKIHFHQVLNFPDKREDTVFEVDFDLPLEIADWRVTIEESPLRANIDVVLANELLDDIYVVYIMDNSRCFWTCECRSQVGTITTFACHKQGVDSSFTFRHVSADITVDSR